MPFEKPFLDTKRTCGNKNYINLFSPKSFEKLAILGVANFVEKNLFMGKVL